MRRAMRVKVLLPAAHFHLRWDTVLRWLGFPLRLTVNKEDLTAQILTLQTRMEASYTTSMILNNLSLLNYMK